MKVFDNLYFLGMRTVSAWAVSTSEGIILIDALYDFSVEDEIVKGLLKVGLNPKTIKYAVITHAHGDHSAGARYLQEHYDTRVLLSGPDWDVLANGRGSKPKHDMVAVDGQKLTLGDTTLSLYVTPGHTPGTISLLIPVKDNGAPHLLMMWGGTAFGRGADFFHSYIASAERFENIVTGAGADGVISNHPLFDGSLEKMKRLTSRKPGEPNPFVLGKEATARYLQVVHECAEAGLAKLR